MFENLSTEFHGLVGMALDDIFKGLKLMYEDPDQIFDSIMNVFGFEFMLPAISRKYGHLFVNNS